jgi:hypothetical protein
VHDLRSSNVRIQQCGLRFSNKYPIQNRKRTPRRGTPQVPESGSRITASN